MAGAPLRHRTPSAIALAAPPLLRRSRHVFDARVVQVRALGGMGLNGGVQLLALSRMRTSRAYAKLISAYTVRPMRHPMKPGGIGWLGDQTLYSWMSVNGTGGRDVFHLIPCGWNRQIGTHMAGWPHFWERHRCATPCHLLHGNYVGHKKVSPRLSRA